MKHTTVISVLLFLSLHLLSLSQNAENLLNQADAAMKEANVDLAISLYSKAIQLSPSEVNSYYKRAAAYLTKGASKDALSDLNKVMTLKPDFTLALLRRGRLLLEMGEFSKSKTDLEAVKKQDPSNPHVDSLLAKLAEARDKSLQAEQIFAVKNFGVARDLLTEILSICKDSVSLRLMRAQCNFELGEWYTMIEDTTRALKVDSGNLKAYLLRGLAVFYTGDTENAIKLWQECLKYDPDNKACRDQFKKAKKLDKAVQKMEELKQTNRFADAIEAANDALSVDPKASNYNNNFRNSICSLYQKLHKAEKAVEACTTALQFDQNIENLLNRADAYMSLDDFDAAIGDYSKAQQQDNGNRRAHDGIHNAQRRKKMAERKDYYKILGVSKDAEPSQIKKAYRKLALQYHPDKLKSIQDEKEKEKMEKMFYDINEAHEVLSDPEKREKWDRGEDLNAQGGGGGGGFNPFQHFQNFGGQTFTFHF